LQDVSGFPQQVTHVLVNFSTKLEILKMF